MHGHGRGLSEGDAIANAHIEEIHGRDCTTPIAAA